MAVLVAELAVEWLFFADDESVTFAASPARCKPIIIALDKGALSCDYLRA